MLVLGRKLFETIILRLPDGREITVQVVGCPPDHKQVRLGIEAANDIVILRGEVAAKKPIKETTA